MKDKASDFLFAWALMTMTENLTPIDDQHQARKRAEIRCAVPPTVVRLEEEQGSSFGVAMNISRSGMCFQSPAHLSVGELIKVKFTLPKTRATVTCRSKVVWYQQFTRVRGGPAHGGIKFVDVDPATAEQIDMWIKTRCESHTQ